MSSLPNSPAVTEWFQRLEAAWRRMPEEERTRQREEVQQHLEGLVATRVAQGQLSEDAWNDALVQLGDPTQIGRKMYYEWSLSRMGVNADMAAIVFGIGCHTLLLFAVNYLRFFDTYSINHHQFYRHPIGHMVLSYGGIFISIAIGRKYPMQALKSSLYSPIFVTAWFWLYLRASFPFNLPLMIAQILPSYLLLVVEYTAVAYLASVTKHGWYRPSLADFKITLPSRTKQISR